MKYSRAKGFSRDDINCMEQLSKKDAREVGLEIYADKKSKMSQDKSKMNQEQPRLEKPVQSNAKKPFRTVEASKFESVVDLRASFAEARNIAAGIIPDYNLVVPNIYEPSRSAQSVVAEDDKAEEVKLGEVEVEEVKLGEVEFEEVKWVEGQELQVVKWVEGPELSCNSKPPSVGRRRKKREREIEENMPKKRGRPFGWRKETDSRQIENKERTLADNKRTRDSYLVDLKNLPKLASGNPNISEAGAQETDIFVARKPELTQTSSNSSPYKSPNCSSSTSSEKPTTSPIKVTDLKPPIIEVKSMGEIPVEILLPAGTSQDPKPKSRGRPRGSYNTLTAEEKEEKKTMSYYKWNKLQRARREAGQRKMEDSKPLQNPSMVPSPEIFTVTEIEKEGKKDEVEDQTKNIVWGLGFLKNLLDEENLKELMKTTNLGDVCQDLGRGIKTTQTKRRKIEMETKEDKASTSMGSSIDLAVNALLGFDTYNFAAEIDAAVEAVANSDKPTISFNSNSAPEEREKPGFDLNALIDDSIINMAINHT